MNRQTQGKMIKQNTSPNKKCELHVTMQYLLSFDIVCNVPIFINTSTFVSSPFKQFNEECQYCTLYFQNTTQKI